MKQTTPPQVKIAITMDNGTVAIMSFVTQSRSATLPEGASWLDETSGHWTRPATDAAIFAEMAKTFRRTDNDGLPLPQPVSYTIVQEADIPVDRTYRNALRCTEKAFHYDLDQAKQIHLDHVREARVDVLNTLDRDWMKATGQGRLVEAAAAEAKRQVLRDLPVTLDLTKVTTVEELKALWPVELPHV